MPNQTLKSMKQFIEDKVLKVIAVYKSSCRPCFEFSLQIFEPLISQPCSTHPSFGNPFRLRPSQCPTETTYASEGLEHSCINMSCSFVSLPTAPAQHYTGQRFSSVLCLPYSDSKPSLAPDRGGAGCCRLSQVMQTVPKRVTVTPKIGQRRQRASRMSSLAKASLRASRLDPRRPSRGS